mmetsp:Transcript_20255/g.26756  ORF Transcript_20255/g.26756 Transcript_20255/m.26756 type:complete len:221 (+) Transcript_20255:142-804(+)|eukprot:CAMPEP_0117739298 /NCGR_PEP_ID=MMETSP0947-20121206/3661_1 /TAXON_ID=44440 /ORGANISM="Chattonella subsalsa, Strain CCMP2191" /LENGTH=220 /DNA_ID=CAMNT_0005555191 /DNA_START=154 /DNA_END=816 /DNA_ORIENTATION=-
MKGKDTPLVSKNSRFSNKQIKDLKKRFLNEVGIDDGLLTSEKLCNFPEILVNPLAVQYVENRWKQNLSGSRRLKREFRAEDEGALNGFTFEEFLDVLAALSPTAGFERKTEVLGTILESKDGMVSRGKLCSFYRDLLGFSDSCSSHQAILETMVDTVIQHICNVSNGILNIPEKGIVPEGKSCSSYVDANKTVLVSEVSIQDLMALIGLDDLNLKLSILI